MKPYAIEVRIGRLVWHGAAPAGAAQVTEALERELAAALGVSADGAAPAAAGSELRTVAEAIMARLPAAVRGTR